MPQMMPMMWIYMFFFTFFIFISLISMIYFFTNNFFKFNLTQMLDTNKWSWKW